MAVARGRLRHGHGKVVRILDQDGTFQLSLRASTGGWAVTLATEQRFCTGSPPATSCSYSAAGAAVCLTQTDMYLRPLLK